MMKSFLDEFSDTLKNKDKQELINEMKCLLPLREKIKIVAKERFKKEFRETRRSERDIMLDLAAEYDVSQSTIYRIVKSCK